MWRLCQLLKINAILGAIGGVVSWTIYAVGHLQSESAVTLAGGFVLAPLCQAALLCVYTLVGYPVLKKLVSLGKVTFE